MAKIMLIIPQLMLRAVFLTCRAKFIPLRDLMLLPIIASSLISAIAGARIYNNAAVNMGVSVEGDASWIETISITDLVVSSDWVITLSSFFSIYFYIHFLKAVLHFIYGNQEQSILSYYVPKLSSLRFFMTFLIILILSLLPGSVILSFLISSVSSNGSLFLFLLLFIFSAMYAFARLSPSLVASSIDQWLNPIDALRQSAIKGWSHSVIVLIVGLFLTSAFSYALLSSITMIVAEKIGLSLAFQSISFHLVISLFSNLITYSVTIPLMVLISLLYKGTHQKTT